MGELCRLEPYLGINNSLHSSKEEAQSKLIQSQSEHY